VKEFDNLTVKFCTTTQSQNTKIAYMTLFKIKKNRTGQGGHLKLNLTNKTANINGKNWPVYNQMYV